MRGVRANARGCGGFRQGIDTRSLRARGEQRRSPYFNTWRGIPRSHFVVGLTMHKIVNTLAVALSVLTNFPSVTVAAEPSPVPASGTWTDVTPSGADLVNMLSCENYGSTTMVADPARPSDLFTQFHCQGVWKSVD